MNTGARALFIDRGSLRTDLVRAIEARHGAIVVGSSGVGKSWLAQSALTEVADRVCVVRVHGSSATMGLDYGALRTLLPGSPATLFDQPTTVLRALTGRLADRAGGRPVTLFVDNAQQLDDPSALVLRQMAVTGVVTLLAVCEDLPHVPGELINLWKDGQLRRIDVGPFTFAETRQWLVTQLGGRISGAAAHALWSTSSGNPLLLNLLLQAQIATGSIVERDGVWVLTTTPLVHSPQLIDTVMAMVGRVSAAEQRVLEMVALAQAVPLGLLMTCTDRHAIDQLQLNGFLRIDAGSPPVVRVNGRLSAEVIRSQIPAGRRQELRAALMACIDSTTMPPLGTLALTSCALDCSVDLEPVTLLTAARLSNRMSDPANALRFLNAMGDAPGSVDVLVERSSALIALAHPAEAADALREAEAGQAESPVDLARAGALRCQLLRADDDRWREAAAALTDARDRIDAWVDAPSIERDRARELLTLAEGELSAFQGVYTGLVDAVFELFTRGSTVDIRLRAGALLCEVWAVTGAQFKAERLADELSVQLTRLGPSVATRDEVEARLCAVFLATSAWDRCDQLLETSTRTGPDHMTAVELMEGLVQCHRGDAGPALDRLLPAAHQLRLSDPGGLLMLASAAIAYAYGLQGEKDLALDFLNDFKRSRGRSSWLLRSTARYFATLASAELASRDVAVRRLVAQAESARERGAFCQELRFLSGAVRLGATGVAPDLADVAARNQGRFGQLCAVFAAGIVSQNPDQLLRAVQQATHLKDDGFGRDVARAAVTAAKERGDRRALQHARDLLQTNRRPVAPELLTGDLQILTAREQEVVADVVSGCSNRAIAARMNVSVRTVEGHLYKIYGKLNINSRAELREVLA